MALAVFVGLVFAGIVLIALVSPIQRRIALRQALRRPRETALVIAGSLLGTAIITGSFIVGDTLETSIRATAHTQLGPIDEIVEVPDRDVARRIERRLEALDDAPIDGVVSFVTASASFATAGDDRRAEPTAQVVELDFDEGRSFGGDADATGISGSTPGPGRAAITTDLAEALDVQPGDRILGFLYAQRLKLDVVRILPRRGLAGYWSGVESRSPNAFVAPGTIAHATGGRIPRSALPPVTTVAVSNVGGVEEGAALTDEVGAVIEGALPSDALRVEPVKERRLEQADEAGDQFSEIFVGIGAFAVVAGILLLVNIFVMLAEERKTELGMLRAIGGTRGGLIRGFVIEGAAYGSLSALLGAALGIGVGWAIVKIAAPIFGGFGDFSLDLRFNAQPASIGIGFCLGVLISFATVALTSVRISRINIIQAIRDLPEPRVATSRLRTVLAGVLLAAVGAIAFMLSYSSETWFGVLVGPPAVVFGLVPLGRRFVRGRAPVLAAASLSLVWGIFGDALTSKRFFESGDIAAFVVQGVLLTFSAVVLLSQLHEDLERALRRVAARTITVRLGLAYPLARRFRTGLTLGMYSLVLFTMVFIAVMSGVFGGQVERTTAKAAGGFDMFATSTPSNPPRPSEIAAIDGIERVSALTYGTALYRPDGFPEPRPWALTGIDEEFVEVGPPALDERAAGMSEREVWETVLADPRTSVVDSFFLQEIGGPAAAVVEPGDEMAVVDPTTGRSVVRRVIGVVDVDATFAGVLMSRPSAEAAIGDRASPTRFYVTLEDDADSDDVAARLQGEFFRNGVEARAFLTMVQDFARANLQFLRLMEGYLALGLIVGIAGLGVVMIRAVRERHHEIGVLRALGFRAPQVRSAFLLESGFIAAEGILTGAVLALITARQLVATGEFGDVAFIIPWGQVAIVTASALAFSLLATLWPARQASEIPPAVALRITD